MGESLLAGVQPHYAWVPCLVGTMSAGTFHPPVSTGLRVGAICRCPSLCEWVLFAGVLRPTMWEQWRLWTMSTRLGLEFECRTTRRVPGTMSQLAVLAPPHSYGLGAFRLK